MKYFRYLLILLGLFWLFMNNSFAQSTQQLCYTTNGNNCVQSVQSASSAVINVSTAATVQIIALVAGKWIFVTSFDMMAANTTNFTYVYGTGSNCGTGTTALTGAYPLIAQAGVSKGNGLGSVLVVPAGNALCVTNSAAVQVSGSVSYSQF